MTRTRKKMDRRAGVILQHGVHIGSVSIASSDPRTCKRAFDAVRTILEQEDEGITVEKRSPRRRRPERHDAR